MNGEYSYLDVAREDLRVAGVLSQMKEGNHLVRLCQQYAEKMLKACIMQFGSAERDTLLLHTHNVRRLAEKCAELKGIVFSKEEVAYFRALTEYYFDTNYPGVDYTRVTAEEAAEVYAETLHFQEKYEVLLTQRQDR